MVLLLSQRSRRTRLSNEAFPELASRTSAYTDSNVLGIASCPLASHRAIDARELLVHNAIRLVTGARSDHLEVSQRIVFVERLLGAIANPMRPRAQF